MKTRLLGAIVLIALAVLFVPMFFPSSPPAAPGDQTMSLAIPPAPDRELQTKTMSLTPDSAAATTTPPAGSSPAQPVVPDAAKAGSDQLATVNIGSNRPRDVETDPAAGHKPQVTTVTTPAANQPLIPMQTTPSQAKPTPAKPTPGNAGAVAPAAKASTTAPAEAPLPAATAARGHHLLNLSAYASASSAQHLIGQVRALGYPASGHAIQQGGKSLTMVMAGPFDTRTAAEAARLKITQSIPGVPARLESGASTPQGDPSAPAPTAAAAANHRAGGWVVQAAAMGSQDAAKALNDKLRSNGFDGFVDSVNAGGKQLWRVRVGPQTQRADAERIRDQIKAKLGVTGSVVSAP